MISFATSLSSQRGQWPSRELDWTCVPWTSERICHPATGFFPTEPTSSKGSPWPEAGGNRGGRQLACREWLLWPRWGNSPLLPSSTSVFYTQGQIGEGTLRDSSRSSKRAKWTSVRTELDMLCVQSPIRGFTTIVSPSIKKGLHFPKV